MSTHTIAGYSVAETLFEGARSLVYKATRHVDGRPVVIKVLAAEYPSLPQIARLRREFRMTREALTDGVVEVVALERHRSSLAIVLEDFGGESLARLVPPEPLALGQLLSFGARLAGALGRVHQRRIIHKDINPSNIVHNPRTDVLKIIDFGIATELSREAAANVGPSRLEGTLAYLSPEQTGRMNRAVDYRTDFYSLGVTLYQLATGRLPFTAVEPLELVHCHIAQVPPPPHEVAPAVPRVVSEIICRLMAKRAEDRYQSAFALQSDLARCARRLDELGHVAAFSIGRGDVSDRFQLPQKLYGREREIDTLLAAFDRVARGGKELMLVAGYSGIGKSVLVHEVHRPIVKRRGHFISGKFDQYNRSVPYASLIQSVEELTRQLLTESADALAAWRERILAAVGPNAQVIIDVIQEVELVVGPQPPVAELPPREAQNRFDLTFESFFRVFAGPEHPLAIFLDDLQWADLPSLRLLERFMTDAETTHMFLVGAYRDNEVEPGHALLVTVDEMRKAGASVETITLAPLGRAHAVELLVDTLRCGADEAGPLAGICLQKTSGNPFFLGQFLLRLHERGAFRFDERAGRWRWDLDAIAAMGMTDNVVDLMAGKIQSLPDDAQHALRLAACIGNAFDLRTLAVFLETTPLEAAVALWPSLQEGLILPIDDAYKLVEDEAAGLELVSREGGIVPSDAARVFYRFLHDRVQQAAYSLVPPERRSELHLQVGRLLDRSTTSEEREPRLFAIVSHLNLGAELIDDQAERDELAALNLAAGRRAKASAAYAAALEHFKKGIALLGAGGFHRQRELAVDLHLHAAEASYVNKAFDQIDGYADAAVREAGGVLVQVKVAEIRIQAFNAQNKLSEAVRTALEILRHLGIAFPDRPAPEDVAAATRELDAALAGRPIMELLELPAMTDRVKIAAIRILAMTIPTSYLYDPGLFPLMAARQVALSVEHGNAGASAAGYAAWGIILGGALGRIDEGYEFGRLALRVLERHDAKDVEARTRYIVSCFIAHGKEPVRESVRALRDVYQTALETGDLDFAGYSLVTQITQLYLGGAELGELERLATSSLQAIVPLRHLPALNYTRAVHQLILNLQGRAADPCQLVGAGYDEASTIASHRDAKDSYGLGSAYLWKLQLCYLFGRRAEAVQHADVVRSQLAGLVGQFQVPTFHLYDALARLAVYPEAPAEERARILARVEDDLARLRTWAEHAPMNYAHKGWLVEAELGRVLGEPERARRAYYRATALAREHEVRNEEALATELFARFLLEQGEDEAAELFMTKARHLYELWGATAKVKQLGQRHPTLLPSLPGAALPSVTAASTTEEDPGGTLDIVSVLKASQAISGEVVLPELLKKMMHIILENAGARRGLLIIEGESPLVVDADRSREREDLVLRGASIAERQDLSQAVVRYVRRTHEAVLLGDARSAGIFGADPYLSRSRPKSLLCQPILRQGELVATLYLENDLTANAFTPDRCRVLELLCAQAAISLENARLYETLESRVTERTRELTEALAHLQQTQRQLVLQEKLASLGMLTSGIAHEIKNPLNFINNFADVSVELAEELREEITGFTGGGARDPARAASIAELVSDLRENVSRIRDHGKRADDIVRGMLMHSRAGSGAREDADINRLVERHVSLAYQAFRLEVPSFEARLEVALDPAAPRLHVAPQEIARVVQNLVANACYAMRKRAEKAGPAFAARLVVSTRGTAEHVEIRVADNGGGIPALIYEHIFTPFFTTKPPGEGTGLGLSMSHEIVVQGYGGTLAFSAVAGESTEFVITLPRRGGGPASARR